MYNQGIGNKSLKNFKNSLVVVSCSYICMELGILFDTNKLHVNMECSKFLGHENNGFWSIKANKPNIHLQLLGWFVYG